MNIKPVQLFVRTVALGSISAAAAELGLSSSLASRQLAGLEKDLGTRLLRRTTRSLQVTEAGALVLRWAQTAVGGFESMRDELDALHGRPAGLVRIACTEYLALNVVARVVSDFVLRYPEIKTSVLTTDKAMQLTEGQFDVAIHVGQVPDSNFVVRRVRDVKTLLCASPRYLALHGEPQHPADLTQHRCLAHAMYEPRNWFFRKSGEVFVHALDPHVTTTSTSMLRELAVQGVGIARLSARMLQEDLRSGRLATVLPDFAQTLSTGEYPAVWMIYPDHHQLQRTRLVVDAIVERMQQEA